MHFAAQYPARTCPCRTLHRHPRGRRRMTWGRRGSLLLRRETLSFSPLCRVIPAHYPLHGPRLAEPVSRAQSGGGLSESQSPAARSLRRSLLFRRRGKGAAGPSGGRSPPRARRRRAGRGSRSSTWERARGSRYPARVAGARYAGWRQSCAKSTLKCGSPRDARGPTRPTAAWRGRWRSRAGRGG
jgi:hypothetical protein